MTAFGNYTLRDNQDVSSFIYYSKKMGGQMTLLLPPGYATAPPPLKNFHTPTHSLQKHYKIVLKKHTHKQVNKEEKSS